MRFLVDALLPRLLAIRLNELGHSAQHTLDLADGNRTPDEDIATVADEGCADVVTKDADFLNSHILSGTPPRLLLVSTGNTSNRRLLGLFEQHINQIASALDHSNLVELNQAGLVMHD